MFIFIVIAGIVAIVIIRFLLGKDQGNTYGKIVKYVEENGKHYPVFSFITKDGKVIEGRNTTYLEELSVEEAYPNNVEAFLSKPLPIENIPIFYNKKDPKDFIPRWID